MEILMLIWYYCCGWIVLDDLSLNLEFLLCFLVVDGLMKYDSDIMKEIMLFRIFFGKMAMMAKCGDESFEKFLSCFNLLD